MKKKKYLMALESSCDDSSVAVADLSKKQLVDVMTYSQDIHRMFGGVVPELASRDHLKKIPLLIDKILMKNSIHLRQLSFIACTNRPGLIGSLLMGLMSAKTLSYLLKIPFSGVNHLYSHIFAGFWDRKVKFPFLAMVISGGHSDMFLVRDYTDISRIGFTVDDAAGEILDKIAKELDLGYPGGPFIEKYAKSWDSPEDLFGLPVPMKKKNTYNLSFSGLKTACYIILKKAKAEGSVDDNFISKLSFSLLGAISDSIYAKAKKALKDLSLTDIIIGGGVMRNMILRERLSLRLGSDGYRVHIPGPEYCSDNAAMVAYLGMIYHERNLHDSLDLNASPGFD